MPAVVRVRLLVVAGLVWAAGCGFLPQAPSNNKGKLEATRWVNEAGSFFGRPFNRGEFTLDFRGDNTFFWRFYDKTFTGTFEYGPGDLVFFKLNEPLLGRTDWREVITLSGDVLIMGGEDGITMQFNRIKVELTEHGKGKSPVAAADTPRQAPKETAPSTPPPTRRNVTRPEEMILGEWGFTETAIDGKVIGKDAYKGCRIYITADKLRFEAPGTTVFEATYKCDFSQQPALIDVTYLSGPDKGKTALGVIDVKEFGLQLTLAETGQPRPTEFNAPPGWKRQRLLLYWVK